MKLKSKKDRIKEGEGTSKRITENVTTKCIQQTVSTHPWKPTNRKTDNRPTRD